MQKNLEDALNWIMSNEENIKAFRADINVIKAQFPDLSDDDMTVLKSVHEKGMDAEGLEDTELGDVVGQRSYGWSKPSSGY